MVRSCIDYDGKMELSHKYICHANKGESYWRGYYPLRVTNTAVII